MGSSGGVFGGDGDALEVGCLHLGILGTRNIKVGGGGMVDLFLNPQVNPYCKITLGDTQFTSGMGIKTTAGHAWNREQMFFPVKVPLACVVGVSGQRRTTGSSGGIGAKLKRGGALGSSCSSATGASGAGAGGGVACRSGLARDLDGADASTARELGGRLTLKAQVFHREVGGVGVGVAGSGTGRGTAAEKAAAAAAARSTDDNRVYGGDDSGGDRLLGECSLNLVEVVSGRAPHIEEWVPLDTGGDLRLSLDYDSVGVTPVPGDSVVLLCLSNRLDFFPLPVWDEADDPMAPGSPSWLWARGASRRLPGGAGGAHGAGGGFRVEEAGDDFFLLSYATPEGWRCAVEVHRFLVYPDPCAPPRWTLSGLRDHALATPAAAAMRGAVIRASREEALWEGLQGVVAQVVEGVRWTACRWWEGGLDRIRDDVLFAAGLMDAASFAESEDHWRRGPERETDQRKREEEEDRAGGGSNDGGLEGLDDTADGGIEEDAPTTGSSATSLGSAGDRGVQNVTELQQRLPLIGCDEAELKIEKSSGTGGDSSGSGSSKSTGCFSPVGFPSEEAEDDSGKTDHDQRSVQQVAEGGEEEIASVPVADSSDSTPAVSRQHLCPITRCPMEDPAVAADGYTYERVAIERWLSEHDTSPVTGNVLETKVVFKNWSLA